MWRRSLIVGLALAAVTGCASQEDYALLHREIADVQRAVEQLRSSTLTREDLATIREGLERQGKEVVRSNADLGLKVDRLEERIEALRASLEVTTRKLDRISQQLAERVAVGERGGVPPATGEPAAPAPAGEEGAPAERGTGAGAPAEPAASPTPVPETPEALYRAAYQDYMRGNYELALGGFREYLERYPDTELADNALYWSGECYHALGRLDEALSAFSTLLEKYPSSDKAAAAQLKKGLVLLAKGDQGQGVINLQYVVYEHPGTKEADIAREKLRSLGITIR